jgi:putative hydrolase of the HAD superfamily
MGDVFRAVVFDFFGTLTRAVRRGPAHAGIARRLGCDPNAFARALDDTFFDRCTGAYGEAPDSLAAVAARAGGHPSQGDLRQAAAERIAALRADITLRDDAVAVLHLLRRCGLRTAVVSDCGPELPAIWSGLPVAPLLDVRVLSIEEGRRKPDPHMYHAACARLGVEPRDCLYVGDGGSRELTGAAAAGLAVVRLAAADLPGHLVFDFDEAWHGPAVASLTEVLPLVSAGNRPTATVRP